MMRALALVALALLALATPGAARADYLDPWGLPSGTATLRLATQDSIVGGGRVQGIDFATGSIDSLSTYLGAVLAGAADLLFVELVPGEAAHWLRAPEDPLYLLDQPFIADLGERPLGAVADMLDDEGDPVPLVSFATAVLGHAYALLQVQAGAVPETTAVKFAVTALADSALSFDWAWQPNGTREFIPTSSRASSLGAIKVLY
jgi:hypothetical protein